MRADYDDGEAMKPFAEEDVGAGRCFAAYFRGQTHIYIPREIGERIGEGGLKGMIEGSFPRKELADFDTQIVFYTDCVWLNVPSAYGKLQGDGKWPIIEERDERIKSLVAKIEGS